MPVLPSRLSGAVQQLERKVINLLATAQSFGSVLILAGCSQRFVRFTMKAYMPDLYTFVTERQINTVSAKTTFETMFPKDEFARKSRAFYKQVKLALAGRTPLRQSFKFVTVGSDRCEREAAHDLRHRIPLDCIKIIELSSKPTLSVVQAQIDKVASMLPEVVLSEEFCAQFVRDA